MGIQVRVFYGDRIGEEEGPYTQADAAKMEPNLFEANRPRFKHGKKAFLK